MQTKRHVFRHDDYLVLLDTLFWWKSSICIRLRNKNMMYEVILGHKPYTKQRNVLHVIDI